MAYFNMLITNIIMFPHPFSCCRRQQRRSFPAAAQWSSDRQARQGWQDRTHDRSGQRAPGPGGTTAGERRRSQRQK